MVLRHISPIHLAHKESGMVDIIALIAVWGTFIITLPQVIQIYETQSAEDLAFVTWFGYVIIGIFWLIYGIERRIMPVIMSSILHLIIDALMIYGIILYGSITL